MGLHKDIEAAIKNSLPQQVGEKLREELEALEKARETILKQEDIIHTTKQDRDQWKQWSEADKRKLKKHDNITTREDRVSLRERDMKVFEAELKAEAATARADELSLVIMQVFKSPVYRKNINTIGGTVGNYNNNTGNTDMVPDGSISGDETKTEE